MFTVGDKVRIINIDDVVEIICIDYLSDIVEVEFPNGERDIFELYELEEI